MRWPSEMCVRERNRNRESEKGKQKPGVIAAEDHS